MPCSIRCCSTLAFLASQPVMFIMGALEEEEGMGIWRAGERGSEAAEEGRRRGRRDSEGGGGGTYSMRGGGASGGGRGAHIHLHSSIGDFRDSRVLGVRAAGGLRIVLNGSCDAVECAVEHPGEAATYIAHVGGTLCTGHSHHTIATSATSAEC